MAGMTKGHTFTPTEVLTISALHSLVDGATLNNVDAPDLASGLDFVNITTPVSPVAGDLRIGSDYLGEGYDGSSWSDFSIDPIYMSLTNSSGSTIALGEVVKLTLNDVTKFTKMTSDEARNYPFGVATATCVAAATVTLVVRGVTQVRIGGSPAVTVVAGDVLGHSSLYHVVMPTIASDGFAKALETKSAGASSPTLVSAYVFK